MSNAGNHPQPAYLRQWQIIGNKKRGIPAPMAAVGAGIGLEVALRWIP